MKKVVLRNSARRDLLHIADWTLERWGEPALRYVEELEQRCYELERFPMLGRPSPYKEGWRALSFGQHVVHYRVEASRVIVVRILSARQLQGP